MQAPFDVATLVRETTQGGIPTKESYRIPQRKIDPSGGTHLSDGTLNDHDPIEIGPIITRWCARCA